MALTVKEVLKNSNINGATGLAYLFEPLELLISESTAGDNKITIDVEVTDINTGATVLGTYPAYAIYDLPEGAKITVDVMKIIQEIQNTDVYKLALLSDLHIPGLPTYDNTKLNWLATTFGQGRYSLTIKHELAGDTKLFQRIPIMGVRSFEQYSPYVSSNKFTEWDYYNVPVADYEFAGLPYHDINLSDLDLDQDNNLSDYGFINGSANGRSHKVGNGFLIWKSTFGGWMTWGFDTISKSRKGSTRGDVSVGMFDVDYNANRSFNDPHVKTNYTSIENSYTYNLKSFELPNNVLEALAGIAHSPAVYMVHGDPSDYSSKIELMKTTGVSVPQDSLADGGDFTISLNSISRTSQKTR